MKIEVRGRNTPVTDGIRDHVEDRFKRVAKQVSDLAQLDVELLVEKNPAISQSQVAEVTLHLKGATLRAVERSRDQQHALKLVSEDMARQVKRHRDKRRGPRAGSGAEPPSANGSDAAEAPLEAL